MSNNANGRRGRRGRQRNGPRPEQHTNAPVSILVADGTTTGWFDAGRDGGFIRRAEESYLPSPNDAFVPAPIVKQLALRRGDLVEATTGRDQRGRLAVADVTSVNGGDPTSVLRRPDFSSLIASYPERKLTLETGQSPKISPELTRRAIDLIAPIGYGQRALIVAPARAGKTMLLQAITEGIAINHPEATLLVLLVDERPEEVSEMISWGRGEVVASSFDQPAERHVDVADMTLERARRLVEQGKDVVIVLDSITRLARAHNTAERGTGRTMCGGLDATAMAKPKAFFGSARSVSPANRRRLAHDHRDGARRDGIAHGRRDLRGVQGNRQQRDQARSRTGREARSSRRSTWRRAARAARTSCSAPTRSTRSSRSVAGCSRCRRRPAWSG